MQIIKHFRNQEKFIIQTELEYFVFAHKAGKLQVKPKLYKQNGMSQEEKLW